METTTKKSMHPLTAIAAVSVILFSLAGIGAITGLIPISHSQNTEVQQTKAAEEPAKSAQALELAAPNTTQASAPEPAKHKVAAKRTTPVVHAKRPAEAPVKVAMADAPVMAAQTPPPPPNQPAPMIEPPKAVCHDCGVIESVREVEKKGDATGSGAAIGGIAGGLLGRQTGNGRGRDVMTVLGAIGGAVAGHEIEKNAKKVKSYEIDIRFDDGTSRLITQDNPPAWRPGDRVKVVNSVITANNGY
ncbi:MAG: glycine zipper 2TM domain-containing protein [Burkholderiales bacterium]|nr:glycine zipper 2TM domain-containing protein [Burkholderiales bacterium]